MIQILIVDDEKPICDLIQMSLTRAGYHCTCVYDGLAAADILERNVFDLILLDVMLPNADGFELMEYIRPLGIPVIFLTARGSVDDRVRGLRRRLLPAGRQQRRQAQQKPQHAFHTHPSHSFCKQCTRKNSALQISPHLLYCRRYMP